MKDINNIKDKYREYINYHWLASKEGDYKLANKMYDKLLNIYNMLEKDKVNAEIFLKEMLIDKNYAVQMWSASDCLGLRILIEDAIETLENISIKKSEEAPRYEAEMVLNEWKKNGKLKF